MPGAPINIGILYETTSQPWGGVNSFFRNFKKYSEVDKRVKISNKFSEADVILTVGHYSGPGVIMKKWQLKNISRGLSLNNFLGRIIGRGDKKLTFRLDGLRRVYAPEASKSDDLLIENLKLADSAVFQSAFSKNSFLNENILFPEKHSIILNGADTDNFHPDKSSEFKSKYLRIVSNSWSSNLNKGFACIAEFSKIEKVRISHIGNWPEDIPSEQVRLLGIMDQEKIGDILREADFLLFPSKNEACSNVVIEALASGLPVLYHNSGGNSEICQGIRFGLPLPKNIQDPVELNQLIEQAISRHRSLRLEILNNVETFSFRECYEKYINHFEELINS